MNNYKRIYPSKHSYVKDQPQRNRNAKLDGMVMTNTSAGVPHSPEAVEYLMKGRLPMTTRLGDLLLEEHEFLELEELREQHVEARAQLTAQELEFADSILKGTTASRAYLNAGYLAGSKHTEKGKLEKARMDATKLRKREHIANYISTALQIRYKETMEEVRFSHKEWLEMHREVLEMSLGRKDTPKTYIINGEIEQVNVRDTVLGVAVRSLEVLGKHYGWLKDKMEVEGGGPVVMLKDFTGMAKQLTDNSDTNEQSDD